MKLSWTVVILYNIHKKDIIYYVVYPVLAIALAIAIGVPLLILLWCLEYPPVGGLKRAVEKIEVVDSVVSLSQPYDTRKVADMTILLKNGLVVDCYDIEFSAPPPYYAKKLLFRWAEIKEYTEYMSFYDTNENTYSLNEYRHGAKGGLDEFLKYISSLEEKDNNGEACFFITDESFLEKTKEEMYRLLPGSPWDYSEDGVYYKFFFVRETAGHFNN